MHQEDVVVPGARDVRGTLDAPDGGADDAVVACPPHPQFGGSRTDRRLTAVAAALADDGVATLRFGYGPWDDGDGETADAAAAVRWAADRYDRVGLFGYSFGAVRALQVAAESEAPVAVSALAPDAKASDAVGAIAVPLQVVFGTRDDTVDWAPVVGRARERAAAGGTVDVVEYEADHHFVGQHEKIADVVAGFLAEHLAP
jgi:alpha/beta superfamily hydrolase